MGTAAVEPFSAMPEFDPELYLRRMGEREVLMADDERGRRGHSQLRDAATALVSCGVISADRAAPLLRGYAMAINLRAYPGRTGSPPVYAVADTRTGVIPLVPRKDSGRAVVVEELHPENPAIAWLWQTLGDFSDVTGGPTGLPAAMHALQAAGLIPAEHPELDALLWVRDLAVPPDERRSRSGPPPAAVPEEWRRFRTGRTGAFTGPPRGINVGVATPVFGGVTIAFDALISERSSFSLHLETSGATLEGQDTIVLARNPLAFWVSDDRGNVYLGHVSAWSAGPGSHERARGSVVEFAALDPAATELTVIAQTARARALIRIAL